MQNLERDSSYGELEDLSIFDRFGVYLSKKMLRKTIRGEGVMLDLGAGYNAVLSQAILQENSGLMGVAVDLNLNTKIASDRLSLVEDSIENALNTFNNESFDYIMIISVLEHLKQPETVLHELKRILKDDGKLIINVPTWKGKLFLEFIAFKLRVNETAYLEMNDHKNYFNKRELWKILVSAGFLPSTLQLKYHKFFLNLYAIISK